MWTWEIRCVVAGRERAGETVERGVHERGSSSSSASFRGGGVGEATASGRRVGVRRRDVCDVVCDDVECDDINDV